MKGSLYKQLQILMTMLAVGFILLFSFACKAKGKENNVAATHQKSKTFPHQDSKLFTIPILPNGIINPNLPVLYGEKSL